MRDPLDAMDHMVDQSGGESARLQQIRSGRQAPKTISTTQKEKVRTGRRSHRGGGILQMAVHHLVCSRARGSAPLQNAPGRGLILIAWFYRGARDRLLIRAAHPVEGRATREVQGGI